MAWGCLTFVIGLRQAWAQIKYIYLICGLGLPDLRDRVTSGLGTDKIYIYLICGLGLPDLRDRVTSGLGTDKIYIYLICGLGLRIWSKNLVSTPGLCQEDAKMYLNETSCTEFIVSVQVSIYIEGKFPCEGLSTRHVNSRTIAIPCSSDQ